MVVKIGILNEAQTGDRRVAAVPLMSSFMNKFSIEWFVETNAGNLSSFSNENYQQQGMNIFSKEEEILSQVDIVLHISPNTFQRIGQYSKNTSRPLLTIGMMDALWEKDRFAKFGSLHMTSFALDLMPRISRAQSMDVLSSMSTISGYKATLIAADLMNKLIPMLTTAAGTNAPAKILVIGAGVAGLQAMAHAKRMGAIVSGYDVRPITVEQIQSVGAKPVLKEMLDSPTHDSRGYATELSEEVLEKQRKLLETSIIESDAIITTALVPGAKAPILITREMVSLMKLGSVIVDLAAERGGNCELTKAGEIVEEYGIKICGPVNLSSTVPYQASQMFSKNICAFLKLLLKDGNIYIDKSDEIFQSTLLIP